VDSRDRISIEGGRFTTLDGFQAGVLRCDELDVLAFEPWRLEAAIAGFEALLRSLSAELVLTVDVRRALPAPLLGDPATRTSEGVTAGSDDTNVALTHALVGHWDRRLGDPTFHRQVTATIRDPDAGTLERDLPTVAEALASAGIPARRLARGDLREHLAAAGLDLRRTAWAERPGHASIGGRVVRAAILDRLPGGPVEAGWLAPLVRCPVEVVVAVHIVSTSAQLAIRALGRRLRDLGAHRLLESERGLVPDAGVDAGLEAVARLRDRLARNGGRPLRLWVTAAALGEDEAGLDAAWGLLRGAFAATSATCRPAHFEHRAAALSVWGLGPPVGAGKLVDSHAAASCVPWLQAEIDDPDGYRIGRMADSGLPVSVAPFDESRHVNANIGIFAASGQGKSFLIGGLLIEARRHGVDAIVVDPEGEYRELVRRLGGTWVDLVTEGAIDPFDLGDDAASACATVVDVCALLCPGITDDERAAVEAAARRVLSESPVYAHELGRLPHWPAREARPAGSPAELGGERRVALPSGARGAAVPPSQEIGAPTQPAAWGTRLRECVRLLTQSAPRVARVLTRFLDGSLAGFLDRPTSPAWSAPLLGVGHREVREELVPVTTYLLGRMLWRIARHSPRRRHIVLDEVGMLSAHPALRSLLAQLARRARKYGSSLVVATQNLQDLLSTEEGTVVASNCAIVLCGGHRAVEVAAMERAYGLSEEQRRRLERAGRGEFVLLAGNRRGIIEVDLPDLYGELIRGH
jgi:hypothetical protein